MNRRGSLIVFSGPSGVGKGTVLHKAMEQLDKLKNCEIHSTVILSHVDERTFKSLGLHLTCEPQRQAIKTP